MKKIFLLILFYANCVSASLSVSIDPDPVVLGQDLQLIIKKVDGEVQGLPDLLPLENDFRIVGTQQSQSYESINGVTHHEYRWIILLNPKHPGHIRIPSLHWGQEKTQALTVEVQALHSQSVSHSDEPVQKVFIQWDISPKHPRVHEQVQLKLKIYHSEPLLDAKITPPEVKNGLLFALDQQAHLFEIINGQRYQVEQYRYILYPQAEGTLEIQGPVLDALEYGIVPAPIHQVLSNKRLKILPPLSGISAQQWLPVGELSFQELTPLSKKMGIQSGDTIVRKILLTAKGLPAQLIPDIQSTCGQACKVYSNPPNIDNQLKDGILYGKKTFQLTYLPHQKGKFNIEPITINWFNTSTRKMQILKIPGISFEVFQAKQQITPSEATGNELNHPISMFWVLLLGLMMGGTFMWFFKKISWVFLLENLQTFEFKNFKLKRACIKNHPSEARLALLNWARQQSFVLPIRDLHDICQQIPDGDFKTELKNLIAYLFRLKTGKSWHGQKLWQAFKQFKFQVISSARNEQHSLNP